MEARNAKLAELEGLRDSLYTSANELGPDSAAYAFLLAQIDSVNSQIVDTTNQQSYQDGQMKLESAKNWQNTSNDASMDQAA